MNFVFTPSKRGLLFCFLLALTTLQARPDNILNNTPCADGSTWTVRTSPQQSFSWRSVVYGNGLFVAVGTLGNQVMTSPDGITWTSRNASHSNTWRSVTYGNGLFVAVSSDGGVMTSPDGINWTARSAAVISAWQSVTYGNGLFVAVASATLAAPYSTVMTSPDGINWTDRGLPGGLDLWRSVTYGNGLFVAVRLTMGGANAMVSSDGINWTTSTPLSGQWGCVTYGNGLFVAGSISENRIITSPDGVTWTDRVTDYGASSITYGNGLFVAVGDYDRINISTNGINWTSGSANASGNWSSVVYGNDLFVAVSWIGTNAIMTSSAGVAPTVSIAANTGNSIGTGTTVTFTATPNGGGTTPTYQWKKNGVNVGTNDTTYTDANLANGDAITVEMVRTAPCPSSATATSNTVTMTVTSPCPDGVTWTNRNAAQNNAWQSITYGNGIFVAVASTGTNRVMTSPDGINWTSRNAAQANEWMSVTYGNGLFVAVSYTGTNRVMTSPDGITWTSRNAAQNNEWWGVTYGNGLFVAVGGTGTNRVMTSPDGITWTSRNAAEANGWWAVTYANGLFVAVAYSGTNRIMTSPDGITWTSRSAAQNNWSGVTYGNGLFVAVSYTGTNRVATSPNGITWTARTAPVLGWTSVTYGNGLFVAVAYDGANNNRVMTSTDGITWTIRSVPQGSIWYSVVYADDLFVAVSKDGTDRVMTSSGGAIPTVSIASSASGIITAGTSVTFTATPVNSGTAPTYQWKKNGVNIGTNAATYTDTDLADGDFITVQMTRTTPCASSTTVTSDTLTMEVVCTRLYVTENGTGNGSSWTSAMNDLQAAINNTCGATEIWVAAGTYKPTQHPDPATTADPRAKCFYLNQNRQIYGGFAGTETQLSQRNPATNPTILSGDIGTVGSDADNCYHVVITTGLTAAAVIDGFTVSGGNANAEDSITYSTYRFYAFRGGGFANQFSSPTLTNLTVSNNSASSDGGGFYNLSSSPTLTNVIVSQNSAFVGGGFLNLSSSPTLTNVTVSENSGVFNGGVFNQDASPTIRNSIIWDNGNGDVDNNNSTPNYTHCIVKGSGGSSAWDSGYGTDGGNNLDTDPLFVSTTDFTLQAGSPAINSGNSGLNTTTTDLAGNSRINGAAIDMGPYEFIDPCTAFSGRIYVTENGTGDGSSWTNATSDLQAAINNTCGITEIWVAAGTYKPTTTTDRTISFVMKNGVAIYGGFAGSETTLSQRNWTNNPTILSGDIGNLNDASDNSYHVISNNNNGLTNTAVLDGFTVTGGKSNDYGGGIYNKSASPTFTNVTVSGNTANTYGGGIYNDNASPTFTNVTVSGNTASIGGGIYNSSSASPTFTNVTVSGNTADNFGGGIYNGSSASPTFTNVTVSGNTANYYGGGVYNYYASPTFTNVTVSGNTAIIIGGGIYNYSASPNIRNSIIWDNVYNNGGTPTYSYSIVQGSGGSAAWNGSYGTDGGNNLDTDPLFVSTTDFTLQNTSPAINSGDDAVWTATGLTTDLAGNVRPVGIVDRGAYENQSVVPVEFLYFTGEATDNGNLLTWATASEENNAGFEVQQSTDARTFEKIGFVIGNGTTYEQQNYEFLDKNTINGVTYYRLKQLDFDGKFEYSNIVSISNANAPINEVAIYPNPVKDVLTIENAAGMATIYNALGQPVRQFEITDAVQTIELNELPKGIYTLQIRKADGTAVVKQFVK